MGPPSDSQTLWGLEYRCWSCRAPKQVCAHTGTQFRCRNFCKNGFFRGFQGQKQKLLKNRAKTCAMSPRSDSQIVWGLERLYWVYQTAKQVCAHTGTQNQCRNFWDKDHFSDFQPISGVQTKFFRKMHLNLRDGSLKRFMNTLWSRASVLIISHPKVSMCTHRHTKNKF